MLIKSQIGYEVTTLHQEVARSSRWFNNRLSNFNLSSNIRKAASQTSLPEWVAGNKLDKNLSHTQATQQQADHL